MEESGGISVDIGAGWGENLIDNARKYPERTYIALEPKHPSIRRLPKNFKFVEWESGNGNPPLPQNSVDEANINFLWGEIRYGQEEDGVNAEVMAAERYETLLAELQPVLKQGATVRILDSQLHMVLIKAALEKKGYIIIIDIIPILYPRIRTRW